MNARLRAAELLRQSVNARVQAQEAMRMPAVGGASDADAVRVCPICFHEIQASDRVTSQHGELLHFLCYTGVPPLPSFLGRNLAQQRERPLCLPCLAEGFGLTEREVKDAVRELTATHRFRVDVDTCWRCREVRTTVSALRPQQ